MKRKSIHGPTAPFLVTFLAITITAGAEAAQPSLEYGAEATRPSLEPGARVRVTIADPPAIETWGSSGMKRKEQYTGTYRGTKEETVTLVTSEGFTRSIPIEEVGKVEVSRGHRSRGLRTFSGAAAGLVVGMTIGMATGQATEPDEGGSLDKERNTAIHAVNLGAIGLIVGGVIGAATGTERWDIVDRPFDDLRVGVVPRIDGGISLVAVLRH